MDVMFQQMPELSPEALRVLTLVSILVGLLHCFLGYRIFRFLLALWGLLLGAGLAAGAVATAAPEPAWLTVVAGVAGGIVGAFAMFFLYLAGIFIFGAALTAGATAAIVRAAGAVPNPFLLLALAVVGGILALFLQKLIIVLATAFVGASSVVGGALALITDNYAWTGWTRARPRAPEFSLEMLVFVLCWVALGVAGVVVQFRFPGRPPRGEPAGEPGDGE